MQLPFSPSHLSICALLITNLCFLWAIPAELKKLRQLDDEGNDITHELSRVHRYNFQLEKQLRELLQSPQGSGKYGLLKTRFM